ncbi:alpha/beta fold hydrolase [Haloprofundus salinisoli]|uniref:alpha/beta fold hydrolase n=1 Tax=Haloprofundus salinisoli TaxID=2876193 RepID=UPI001CCD3FD0|nr:alpha/beta hydrolase [Haloprofundus salinisoli]
MTLRRAIGGAVLGIGAVAAANRMLTQAAGELEPGLIGEQRTYRWRGTNVAYTEAGDPDDPDLVLLHGINAAASSGEFRELFSELASEYHVVAPDLPGFGRSDRPPLRYSAALYEDFVTDFLGEFDEPAVLASSLSAAYAAAAARDTPVSQLILVCPTAKAGPEPKQALRELVRAPLLGSAAYNLITARRSLRYFSADHGYYDASKLSDEWLDYQWRTTHQKNARFAPASFVSGYLNSDIDLGETLAELDVPVTLVWGREADVTPLSDGRALADEADARLVVFDDAMLLPHVEHPESFLRTVREELAETA